MLRLLCTAKRFNVGQLPVAAGRSLFFWRARWSAILCEPVVPQHNRDYDVGFMLRFRVVEKKHNHRLSTIAVVPCLGV